MIALTDIARQGAEAPAVGLETLAGAGGVLFLAPHPDDESLAAGAALAMAAAAGRRVVVAVVTDGARSHPGSRSHPPAVLAALRRDEVTAAVAILTDGRGEVIWLGHPDMAAPDDAPGRQAVVRRLAPAMQGIGAIWTTWAGDPHPDHQRVWRLAEGLAAAHPQVRLWGCPVWGRVQPPVCGFDPRHLRRFAPGAWRGVKARAVAAHVSQMTGLIADCPEGFVMPAALAAHFVDSDELFLAA